MFMPSSRRGLPLTPGSSRKRHFPRSERTRKKVVIYLCLVLVFVLLLGAAYHNVRFFYRRTALQRDGPRHTRTARDSLHGDAVSGIGIEHETSEALLDGGEGAREEKTALAVSSDRKLIESGEGDEIALFEGVGTEVKLLGGEKQADVGKTSLLGLKDRKGALGKDWEDENEPLEEDEISVHRVDGAVLDVVDEEAVGGEKDGLDGEREEELEVGIKSSARKEDPAKAAGKAPKKEDVSKKEAPKRKSGHSSCDPHFASSEKALAEPAADTRRFEDFELRYVGAEEMGRRVDAGELEEGGKGGVVKKFNGRQTWEERDESFRIKDPMTVHCGFVGEPEAGLPGFHLDLLDSDALASCRIAVVSATFGASDAIHSISKSQVSDLSHRTVCFVLFLDDHSLAAIKKDKKPGIGKDGRIGIWRPVVVRPPMPYDDPRRIGKIPKLLAHRLFPNARYSIWVDAKLKLAQDPRAVLKRFLWRVGAEYAISNHYDRHDVKEEVSQNKKLKKYDHTAIDEQYETYVREGLDPFNASDPNKPLPSYVPEGSFIIREHTPMSNLFSCLWFNEVDRFTSRDQLSFAHTFLRLVRANPDRRIQLKMFLDCERRATAKLYRHRGDGGSTQKKRTAS